MEMQSQIKRKKYTRDAPSDDILTLIQLVRQNPALYNYKLQPNQRRRIDVLNGWSHIAAQIGNKYTVEECRRKWKNLRDTYHQYRLRKPKVGDGLSKWRYAKELEFLSTVYQPKLKMHRQIQQLKQHQYDSGSAAAANSLSCGGAASANQLHTDDDSMVHSTITLVNDDAETFILTTYQESVNDHEDNMDMELNHDDDDEDHNTNHLEHHQDVHIVKNEITDNKYGTSLDDDGATGAEVDYEEVCLYEEAGNTQNVDCETIIGAGAVARSSSTDSKAFQYIDANDFCIGQLPKLKNVTVVSSASVSSVGGSPLSHQSNNNANALNAAVNCLENNKVISSAIMQFPVTAAPAPTSSCSPVQQQQQQAQPSSSLNATHHHHQQQQQQQSHQNQHHQQQQQQATCSSSSSDCVQTCEELDLFFDFLKKKLQRFSKSEITNLQVEFLNCVLRREADKSNGQ